MRLYLNDRLVKRNARLSKILVGLGMGLLVLGLIQSFRQQDQVNNVLFMALAGMILSQVGMTLFNRWGRSPRDDEVIDIALKGLDDQHAIYHYVGGLEHLLIGPQGAYVLVPRYESGEITFSNGKWWHYQEKRGFLRGPKMRAISDLESSVRASLQAARRFLSKRLPDQPELDPQPLVVFLNSASRLKSEQAPIPTVHVKKLKSWLRRSGKSQSISPDQFDLLA